ncbi:hypothetical protein KHP60_05710 [Microvirga sp. 3-52]|uniref:hypothetical protein n=1 Tax=Microvirga sp. 3-52 TaxID=2792425 RepID=UPI001AD11A73|nr:hypothetical protein [Microvirga sp. 3-52]MBO1904621.1 hypothetical protein [Microvirga sp. 3-52]MBS7451843.1 hypothetical protein [Microvirga sp. 3-52]
MSTAPILFHWTGEAMVPHRRFQKECDRSFVVGEEYRLAVQEHRSQASHSHYFAAIHLAWMNLPESQADRFPTEEHLRKYALIKAGYRDERSIVCNSKAEAQRIAAFIKPMDEFAVVTTFEAVVTVWTAKSQSKAAMGKQVFQESKNKVLDVLAEMIGTQPETLTRNVGRAA